MSDSNDYDMLELRRSKVKEERDKSFLIECDFKITKQDGSENDRSYSIWVPKSQIEQTGSSFKLPRWLVREKENDIGKYLREKKGVTDLKTVGLLVLHAQ